MNSINLPIPTDQKHDPATLNRILIRGTFNLSQLKPFVYLIKSLCPESGHLGEFRDWDRVYNAPTDVKAPKNSIRLRTHLVVAHGHNQSSLNSKDPTFSLMYLGIPDRRVSLPCEKRPVTTVAIGKDANALLNLLGCIFVYEYVRKGVRHRTRHGLTVDVYIVEKLRKPGDPTSCKNITDGDDQHGIVEIISESATTPEQLTTFMQHLSPFVTLRAPVRRRP